MEEQKKYVCPLCGTQYDTPKAMAHCILECEEKQRAETERLRRQKLNQEKDKRWDEVVKAHDVYRELCDRFFKDYPIATWKTKLPVWDVLCTVAVDRRGKDAGADFIPCVAFNKTAEWIEKYFSKGKMIAIDGRIQTRNWTDDDGEKHYVTEIIVDNAEFCGDKSGDGAADSGTKKTTSAAKKDTAADNEEDPF